MALTYDNYLNNHEFALYICLNLFKKILIHILSATSFRITVKQLIIGAARIRWLYKCIVSSN